MPMTCPAVFVFEELVVQHAPFEALRYVTLDGGPRMDLTTTALDKLPSWYHIL